jgi:chromosome segregation ATPase
VADAAAKLEAMATEREALRAEVEELRKQLESIQAAHEEETALLKTDVEETRTAKELAEAQYQTLLGRVEKIKETLSDRLKRDKQELEEAKERIEELETQNEELHNSATAAQDECTKLKDELSETSREVNTLRSRTNLSQQNWSKEKDELARRVAHLTAELESTSGAMGEWEVIAMEERAVKESLADKVSELEEQLASVREGYESAANDRDRQSQAIDSLQKALQELQETRKKELREMVESSEEQLEAMKKLVQQADVRAVAAETERDSLRKELERTAPFEKEVKEKNLLIGKLRHEAIVLNDHLTKALRYLKKTKPEDNVDK